VLERPLQLLIDPRVAAEGVTIADLRAQYELDLAVRATLALANHIASGIDTLRQVLAGARSGQGGAQNQTLDRIALELDELEGRLRDADGSYPQPMLLNQIGYLLGMISSADQAPGEDAYVRHDELRLETEAARGALEALERRLRAVS
jgi:hypothetical protein